MQRLPETQAIVKSFPWGRVEIDGSFSFDVARGRFKVLGASDHGYWSHRGGPVPHQSAGDLGGMSASVPYAQLMRNMLKSFDHLDGKDLLKKKHLTDLEGWRLSNRSLIPLRDFSAARRNICDTRHQKRIKHPQRLEAKPPTTVMETKNWERIKPPN
ncbi:hypothetical protein PM082_006099 [Marasmius tenuissimus]|nr:hypothetical protein PM082_006099 [Marasmius tenuissimus]